MGGWLDRVTSKELKFFPRELGFLRNFENFSSGDVRLFHNG